MEKEPIRLIKAEIELKLENKGLSEAIDLICKDKKLVAFMVGYILGNENIRIDNE